jgi:predicted transcriptional regulator
MNNALDDIAFLANSENRVQIFELIVEAPRNRTEIDDQVDASRVTIARILNELDARDWITQSGQECAVTPLGAWVYDEFTGLVDEIEAGHRLRDAIQLIPTDLLTFDVRCLRDAEIIPLEESDPTAVTRRIVEFHRSGDRIRGVARVAAPVFIKNQWELTVHGDTRLALVITPGALDVIRDHSPTVRRFRDMLEEESASWFLYEEIPISVGIVNGRVGINLTDEEGVLKGGLVTDDESVHAWAVDLFEDCRDKARPVDPDEIAV